MRQVRWAVVVLYVASIYLTIPFATRAWLALSDWLHVSPGRLSAALLSTAAVVVAVAILRRSRPSTSTTVGLAGSGAAYAHLLAYAFVEPIERIHLIEYGALPWLIWWALGRQQTVQTLTVTWVLSAGVGIFDELIQHFTPGRFGELRDILINWESSALGLALMALAARNHRTAEPEA